jgi:acyl dehydratase
VCGDRLRTVLDRAVSDAVLGPGPPLAHPALVWDTAIGQSSAATGRVIANLFYRGLLLHRPVRIGDTLRTVTEVVARRENRVREGRPPTGLVVLRIRTVDQEDRPVLDFTRCPMIPLRDEPTGEPGDEVGGAADLADDALRSAAAAYDLSGVRGSDIEEGDLEGGDVVDSAPALARMTLNVAMAHFDATRAAHGQRLVYGGHTIALAADQAARAAPGLVTILGWHAADHTGPVFEGDTLRSSISVERRDGPLVHLRSRVHAVERDDDVLDWRFVGVLP